MHVAICLWGILRSLHFTLPSFQRHLFSVLEKLGHTYDIYVHTYKITGRYSNFRSSEFNVMFNHSEWKLLNPVYVFIEDQQDFDHRLNVSAYLNPHGSAWGDQGTFVNHIRALNSLYHITQVLESAVRSKNVSYDAVIYIRPDLLLLNDIPIELLQLYPDKTIFTPDFHRSCNGSELNDRVAMGKYPHILHFGRRLESAWSMAQVQPLHSERLTYYHLQHSDLDMQIVEIPFRFHRMRSTGLVNERDFLTVIDPTPYFNPTQKSTILWLLSFILPESKVAKWTHKLPPTHQHYSSWRHHYLYLTCHPHRHLSPSELHQILPKYTASSSSWDCYSPRKAQIKPQKLMLKCEYQWEEKTLVSDLEQSSTFPVMLSDNPSKDPLCRHLLVTNDPQEQEIPLCHVLSAAAASSVDAAPSTSSPLYRPQLMSILQPKSCSF